MLWIFIFQGCEKVMVISAVICGSHLKCVWNYLFSPPCLYFCCILKELWYHHIDIGWCSLRMVLPICVQRCTYFLVFPLGLFPEECCWRFNCTCDVCKLGRSSSYCTCTSRFTDKLENIEGYCEIHEEKVNAGSSRREIITKKVGI